MKRNTVVSMHDILKELLTINSKKKNNIDKYTIKWRIEKYENLYSVTNGKERRLIEDICLLFDIIQFPNNYIVNASELYKMNKVLKRYKLTFLDITQIRWHLKQNRFLDSFSIVNVNNMKEYLAKGVITGKYVPIIETYFYSLICDKHNKNYILISDFELFVDGNSNFTLNGITVKHITITNLDISSLKDISYLFKDCTYTETIHLQNFNTINAEIFTGMFQNCISLREINMNILKTDNAYDMSWMFCNCNSLKRLDLNKFDVSNCRYFTGMFKDCANLIELKID